MSVKESEHNLQKIIVPITSVAIYKKNITKNSKRPDGSKPMAMGISIIVLWSMYDIFA